MRTGTRSLAAVMLLWLVGGPAGAQGRWQTFCHSGETLCLAATTDGSALWSGTNAGIRVFELRGGTVRAREIGLAQGLPGRSITALCFEPDAVWVGTANGRAERLDLVTNEWRETTGLPAAPVNAICYDGRDVWAATSAGIARYNGLTQSWDVYDERDGLRSARAVALAADADGLWAATERGLARYRRDTLGWDTPRGADERLTGQIRDVHLAGKVLWVASAAEGLSRIDLTSGELVSYDLRTDYQVERVDRVTSAANGDVLIACDRGLLIAPGQGTLGPWRLIPRDAWEVCGLVALPDAVWVATRHQGVWKYDWRTDEWTSFAPAQELPPSALSGFAAQADRGWCGFAEHGLAVYDSTADTWRNLEPPAGMPHRVRAVAATGNRVYLACRDGIAVYDQRFSTWSRYLSSDQLPLEGDEWTDVATSGDAVYFAGPGRVSVFATDMELLQTYPIDGLEGARDGSLPKLHVDESSGTIWLVSATMAHRYEPRTATWGFLAAEFFLPREAPGWRPGERLIEDIASDNDSVWFVARDRVVQFDKQLGQDYHWDAEVHEALGAPRLVATDQFSVWFATGAGLCRYSRVSGRLDLTAWPAELEGAEPTALAVDPQEPFVWVATARAAARLDLSGEAPRWQAFSARTGIVDQVMRIVPGRDVVWFVGPNGLSVYRRERTPAGG